jgi:misacylated tRNA(Ala) deacylase
MAITELLFQHDAYLRYCSATVVEVLAEGVVLDRTVFYPLGGGQPGDTGVLQSPDGRSWTVLGARKGEGVEAVIDWDRRHAHMRMHSCLHLLGSVLRYGVTGGQITAEKSRLDFDTQDEIDPARVTESVNALIAADHFLRSTWITDEELDRQPELIRTMSVKPPRGAGRIRLLEIPGVDLQPCGGTHVARTAEIGPITVTRVENKGRHNKRVYVAFG